LRDIIIIAICGVICGADGWVGIEEFGRAKEAWLSELLQLPNGIPSHVTFGRVFAHIDPKQFEASFQQWVQGISTTIEGVIAIDGKTSRRTHDHAAGKKALQRVACMGCRKPPGVGSVGHRGEIERDHCHTTASLAASEGLLHRHH
jgi:DDE family transposase